MNQQKCSELILGIKDVVDSNLSEILRLRHKSTRKPDGSPVTEADVMIEKKIESYLRSQIPNLSFTGEESYSASTDLENQSNYQAVLDPIDGTENFCSGLKEWGVSFSLWKNAEHIGSMLYLPELGDFLKTGSPVQKIPSSQITGLSSSLTAEDLIKVNVTGEFRVMGCAVYNLYNVIRGSYKRFVNPRGAQSWDLLAGLMLARENGCKIMVEGNLYEGQFLPANRKYRIDIQHQ